MVMPSFSNSPWIRGAPQRQFSAAIRRIRSRQVESMRGLPGRRERRQHLRCLRDANDRRWLAGSARALPAAGARTTAETAKTAGQRAESADSNERGRSTGGAEQEFRAGGPYVSRLIGPHPSRRHLAWPVECRAATPTSVILAGRNNGEAHPTRGRQIVERLVEARHSRQIPAAKLPFARLAELRRLQAIRSAAPRGDRRPPRAARGHTTRRQQSLRTARRRRRTSTGRTA